MTIKLISYLKKKHYQLHKKGLNSNCKEVNTLEDKHNSNFLLFQLAAPFGSASACSCPSCHAALHLLGAYFGYYILIHVDTFILKTQVD